MATAGTGSAKVRPPSVDFETEIAVTGAEGGPVSKDLWIGQSNGASGACCFTDSTTSVQLNAAGVYRFSTTAIDQELNLSSRPSAVVKLGGATGEPPIASASLDRSSGPVPLTVNIDMSASTDPDGTVQWYYMSCGDGGSTFGSQSPLGSCRYDTPGVYWLMLQVQDNSGNVDLVSAYVVATPVPGGPDTENPTVSITSPSSGAHVSGNVSITANASDNFGVTRVDYFLDSGTTPIGSATSVPYTITWDSGTTSPGSHSLSATARDAAGNTGASAAVPISVDTVKSQVADAALGVGASIVNDVSGFRLDRAMAAVERSQLRRQEALRRLLRPAVRQLRVNRLQRHHDDDRKRSCDSVAVAQLLTHHGRVDAEPRAGEQPARGRLPRRLHLGRKRREEGGLHRVGRHPRPEWRRRGGRLLRRSSVNGSVLTV